ncbi:MAG: YtxH domain-containing protein [Chloroflexi bacterium]|nr:YtxH domain-containing protein [Chloroflexota bacterium]
MLEGVDLRSGLMMVLAVTSAAGLGWLIGLVMGAGAILLLAPTSGREVQATLQRLFKQQEEKQ